MLIYNKYVVSALKRALMHLLNTCGLFGHFVLIDRIAVQLVMGILFIHGISHTFEPFDPKSFDILFYYILFFPQKYVSASKRIL